MYLSRKTRDSEPGDCTDLLLHDREKSCLGEGLVGRLGGNEGTHRTGGQNETYYGQGSKERKLSRLYIRKKGNAVKDLVVFGGGKNDYI